MNQIHCFAFDLAGLKQQLELKATSALYEKNQKRQLLEPVRVGAVAGCVCGGALQRLTRDLATGNCDRILLCSSAWPRTHQASLRLGIPASVCLLKGPPHATYIHFFHTTF